MQFRTVEDIEEIIPAELRQEVEIKVFKELNSIIVSGSRPQINEVRAFLNGIDELVPNILIEVMVVEVRKGTVYRPVFRPDYRILPFVPKGRFYPGWT